MFAEKSNIYHVYIGYNTIQSPHQPPLMYEPLRQVNERVVRRKKTQKCLFWLPLDPQVPTVERMGIVFWCRTVGQRVHTCLVWRVPNGVDSVHWENEKSLSFFPYTARVQWPMTVGRHFFPPTSLAFRLLFPLSAATNKYNHCRRRFTSRTVRPEEEGGYTLVRRLQTKKKKR